MSTIVSPVDAARTWLERIMTSKVVGFSVLDENGTLVQCIDDDPELREALMEYQAQRIRQLERSQRPASLQSEIIPWATAHPGDEKAFAELAWQANNAGTSPTSAQP